MKQTRDIRRNNQLSVLQRIYASSPISRQELTHTTDLSPATIANVVNDLLRAEIIVEASFVPSSGGRPRAMLEVRADSGAFIGIDIAETYIHFELFDMGLRYRETVERVVHPDENQPTVIVDFVVEGLEQIIEQSGLERPNVLGVGISVPGLVERSGGVSVFAPNWGWHNVPLADMLRERVNLPISLDNPLKVRATAELWFGAGRDRQNVITLNLGTGVGVGIIVHGMLYRGTTNSAGEWGHTTIVPNGRPCRCGNLGCVEAYVGAPGIIQTIHELAPRSVMLHEANQMATIDALAGAAHQDDPDARAVLEYTAFYLGIAVANLVNLFNPEVVTLGSWVGMRLGAALLPHLQPVVKRHALSQTVEAMTIQLCTLPRNPISIGAATLALEAYLLRRTALDGLTARPRETKAKRNEAGSTRHA